MVKCILVVTISVSDLAAVERAYTQHLDYRVVERGKVSKGLASVWGAAASEGRPVLLMLPASGDEVYLRFVESPPVAGYAPLKTYGWNSTELLVKDPDEMAARLKDSPFKIIGPPRDLSNSTLVRAMQVTGPADEVLYLTRFRAAPGAFDYGNAKTDVDRTFIVVVGGKDFEAMRNFYAEKLKLDVMPSLDVRISVLSKAHGLDAERRYQLSLARLPERFAVEIDAYPPSAVERPRRANELPPGMAMVSFGVESFAGLDVDYIKAPAALAEKPYDGRRAAVTRGAADELIELVEAGATKVPRAVAS